ncbi:MAG: hypothetical protein ACYDHH_05795 [Solirubrobacteraceae bacterium]
MSTTEHDHNHDHDHDHDATEEELRAAYEAEMSRIRVEQIILEQVVTLVNLGMRRTGLAPGTDQERDPTQVMLAIEAVRALMPLLEQIAPSQVPAIRQALSQLQLAYVRIGGTPPQGEGAAAPSAGPGAPSTPNDAGGPVVPGGPGGSGAPGGPGAPDTERVKPGEPGPAQRSGKLWIPGQ